MICRHVFKVISGKKSAVIRLLAAFGQKELLLTGIRVKSGISNIHIFEVKKDAYK